MSRTLYGGTDQAYLAGSGAPPVFTDATFTTQITDLRAVNADGSAGAAQATVVGDGYRYYAYFGPDGFTAPMFAPKAYLSSGAPDPSEGALRIDPNPSATYAPKATNAGTTGQVLTKQSDGTVAFATVSGGGGDTVVSW